MEKHSDKNPAAEPQGKVINLKSAVPSAIEKPKTKPESPKREMSRSEKRLTEAREQQYQFEADAFDGRLISTMDRFLEEWDGTIIGYGMEVIVRYDDLWKMTADNHNNHKKIVCRVERNAFRLYLEQLRLDAAKTELPDADPEGHKPDLPKEPEELLTFNELVDKYGNSMNVYNPKIKIVLFNGNPMSWVEFIPVLQNRTPLAESYNYAVTYDEKQRILIIDMQTTDAKE